MRRNPYTELKYMHHTARYFLVLDRWAIVNRDQSLVAVVTTSTTKSRTEITLTLVLGEHRLSLDPIIRPGGMRTALCWVCQELNNGNLWLRARLLLEREARLLDYDEPELLACWHAYDYQYCLRLLANLPGLLGQELD